MTPKKMVDVLQDFVERFQALCSDRDGKTNPADKKRIEEVKTVIHELAGPATVQLPIPPEIQTPKQEPKPVHSKLTPYGNDPALQNSLGSAISPSEDDTK
jgi:hypothetical protein